MTKRNGKWECQGYTVTGDGKATKPEPRTLSALREKNAYVLVVPHDAGADSAIRTEQNTAPGTLVRTCRDFICLHRSREKDWKNLGTIFLTDFEELRAPVRGDRIGLNTDPRIPLDKLRSAIDTLRPKRWRIITKPSTWLGLDDEKHLARLTPDKTLDVLFWVWNIDPS